MPHSAAAVAARDDSSGAVVLTKTELQRVFSKVGVNGDGCWIWNGVRSARGGYGEVGFRGRCSVRVHRLTYRAFVGSIPGALELDHRCNVRACVNPAHLAAVTGRENVLRGASVTAANARKTRCAKGHELTRRGSRRVCLVCKSERDASRQARPDRYRDARRRGLCVRCLQPSPTYRCGPCRAAHNASGMNRRSTEPQRSGERSTRAWRAFMNSTRRPCTPASED